MVYGHEEEFDVENMLGDLLRALKRFESGAVGASTVGAGAGVL